MVLIDQAGVLFATRALAHLMPFLDQVVMPDVAERGENRGREQRKNTPRQLVCGSAYRLLVTQLPAAADWVFWSSFAKA